MLNSTVARSGASVAEDLNRAQQVLLQDLRTLREAAPPAPDQPVDDLRARLAAVRKDIAEEQNGYLDIGKKREPRLERAIGHLIQEHQELLDAFGCPNHWGDPGEQSQREPTAECSDLAEARRQA